MLVALSALLLQLRAIKERFQPLISNSTFLHEVLEVPSFVEMNHQTVGKDLAAWIITQTLQISPENKSIATPQGLADFIASIKNNLPYAIEFNTDYHVT